MIWSETALPGLLTGRPARAADERGWFARIYCRDELAALGIDFVPTQISVSHNVRAGTLRGMHWQAPPCGERKLIRCIAGRVFDVLVDLRAEKATYRRWLAFELTAGGGEALFVPAGLAHGFLTLSDDAALEYMIDAPYDASAARGVRWNDPAFGIAWPAAPAVMNDRDRGWPDHAG